jgi:hypothetical protein
MFLVHTGSGTATGSGTSVCILVEAVISKITVPRNLPALAYRYRHRHFSYHCLFYYIPLPVLVPVCTYGSLLIFNNNIDRYFTALLKSLRRHRKIQTGKLTLWLERLIVNKDTCSNPMLVYFFGTTTCWTDRSSLPKYTLFKFYLCHIKGTGRPD